MGHKGLLESKQYRNFISDRDKALEKIHQNAQLDVSRFVHEALTKIEKEVLHLAHRGHQTALNVQSLSYQLEMVTLQILTQLVSKLSFRFKSLRRSTYSLSYLAQLEAIGRAIRTHKKVAHLSAKKIQTVVNSTTIQDQDLTLKIWLDVMKLRERFMTAFRLALIQELPSKEVLAKVKKTFPKIRIFKKAPRQLSPIKDSPKKVKEANYLIGDKKNFSFKAIDQDQWESTLDDYKDTQLPHSRFDSDAIEMGAEEDNQIQYTWELEQTLTQDFVDRVRQGDIEGAQALGIEEFIWVAVIDDRTDTCCLERNGLTTSEIAGKVEEEDFDSDCDALYPPAHFNCRCQLSPVASADEVEGPNWASFKDWLES